MRILVLGAGATGGYYGGRLVEAGADITFLVRQRRADELARDGLIVESPGGDIRRRVAVVTAETLVDHYDLVLLSCKAYDLEAAIAAITPGVGDGSYVLPLLNGMRHLDRLDEVFGRERVLGGLAQITAAVTPDGIVHHLSPLHRLVFGPRTPGQEAICRRLAEVITKAGFDAVLSEQILQEMWEKHAFIATLAGTTCLMRGALCDILAHPGGEGLVIALQEETVAIVAAAGIAPRPKALAASRKMLTDPRSTMVASMLRDVEAGRPTEADHILGDLLVRGKAQGMAAPLLGLAYLHLQTYAARTARETSSAAG